MNLVRTVIVYLGVGFGSVALAFFLSQQILRTADSEELLPQTPKNEKTGSTQSINNGASKEGVLESANVAAEGVKLDENSKLNKTLEQKEALSQQLVNEIDAAKPDVHNSAPDAKQKEKANAQANPLESANSNNNFDLFLEPYNYDPTGRRNPFQRIDNIVAEAGNSQRPLLPLENFELSQLKLLGIIKSKGFSRIMIKDPTGKVHVLTKDQRIGRNQGYIADIRESEIVVVETREDNGDLLYSTQVLKIK
ncbi:MAG: hypothetical protein HOO06_06060 [Bdellovibrionaceae bacterium]|jgi:Tfp pilus assembly protein PilP|nr:hypothetical protein [Pseudobdellovibrionaceae bacterium]